MAHCDADWSRSHPPHQVSAAYVDRHERPKLAIHQPILCCVAPTGAQQCFDPDGLFVLPLGCSPVKPSSKKWRQADQIAQWPTHRLHLRVLMKLELLDFYQPVLESRQSHFSRLQWPLRWIATLTHPRIPEANIGPAQNLSCLRFFQSKMIHSD
jgi:hypothetical protein